MESEAASFPKRLQQLVDERAGGNISQFARLTGGATSEALLRKYLGGKSLPGLEKLQAIARAGGVTVGWLAGESSPSPSNFSSSPVGIGIPVVSRIRAGLMSLYEVEQYAEEYAPLDEAALARTGERLFGLRVEGDSNEPWLYDGDIAICSTVRTAEVGDDVAYYRRETGESTIKRLDAYNQKSHMARLRPINPKYDPFTVQLERGDQMAVVVGVYRPITRSSRRLPPLQ